MSRRAWHVAWLSVAVALWAHAWAPAFAHRTVISQYTFTQDVRPVLLARCGACHGDEGPTPLLRYREARALSWRMQQELLTGRMPPWDPDDSGAPLQGSRRLTPREFDVLMTWAAGGAPEGPPLPDTATGSTTTSADATWPLGRPDVVLSLPDAASASSSLTPLEREYTLPATTLHGRAIRGVDLRPSTAALVRRAEVAIVDGDREQVVTWWLPDDAVASLTEGAFAVSRTATLRVRLQYRAVAGTARPPVTAGTTIGIYFAATSARPIQALSLGEGSTTVTRRSRALSWRVETAPAGDIVQVVLIRPDGTRRVLARTRPHADWPRRYVFAQPIALPPRSQLLVSSSPDPLAGFASLLGGPERAAAPPVRIALDITR